MSSTVRLASELPTRNQWVVSFRSEALPVNGPAVPALFQFGADHVGAQLCLEAAEEGDDREARQCQDYCRHDEGGGGFAFGFVVWEVGDEGHLRFPGVGEISCP